MTLYNFPCCLVKSRTGRATPSGPKLTFQAKLPAEDYQVQEVRNGKSVHGWLEMSFCVNSDSSVGYRQPRLEGLQTDAESGTLSVLQPVMDVGNPDAMPLTAGIVTIKLQDVNDFLEPFRSYPGVVINDTYINSFQVFDGTAFD